MSGVEVLALMGVIANVLQLVDFSCRTFSRIKECRESNHNLPKAFWSLQNQLPLISHALQLTLNQAKSGDLDESTCYALRPVVQDCAVGIYELKAILEKVAPSPDHPKWKKSLTAVTSCFHDEKVALLTASLSSSLTTINQYHGAYTAASTGKILQKLTAAVATIPDKDDEGDTPVRHFMIPAVWSDDFIGRKDTMDRLDNVMSDNEKHRRVAIVGLGGIGKTRLMLEYAYRLKNSETHSMFWVHGSSISRINKTFAEIARKVKIPGWEDAKSNKVNLVKDWLEKPFAGKWVLLVDNADDFHLLFGRGNLIESLPRSSKGAILLTTRDARVGMEFAKRTTITLSAFSLKDSMSLLDTRLGPGDNDSQDVEELSEELCGIPLALVQASSFISQNFLTIPDYLELYRSSDKDKIELLSEDFNDDIRDPETRNPVAATWSITFDHILKRDPLAAETLAVMSTFDAQAIPESLISSGNKLQFSKALGTLQAFTLITVRTDGPTWEGRRERLFDLHRLVRLTMHNWLHLNGELEIYTARALNMLAKRFTDGQWENRGKWATYLPHAAVLLASEQLAGLEDLVMAPVSHDNDEKSGVVNHIPEGIVCPICAASLLTILSICHYTIGRLDASLEEAERAYRLRKQFLEENHLDTLASLDLIGKPAKDLYLFPKAVEACQLAIKGKSEALGADHPSTLRSMAILGITYRPMGQLEEAKEIGMHVLETRRRTLGNTHPDTLSSMCYVGTVYRASGDYETALRLETEKLQGWTNLRGVSHPETLEAMAGVSWAYACQGNYDRATPLMSQSLSLQIELRGPRHTFTMWTMANMAVILGMQGKYLEAEELCQRAITCRTEYIGASHPFTYVSKLYLAWLYNETDRYKQAETLELEVLDFQKIFYKGDTHHDVLLTKSQLASTYTFMGRHQAAESIKSEVLTLRLELTGLQHPVTLRCKSSLGTTMTDLGRHSEAESLLSDAWNTQKKVLGDEHPETCTTMSRIAKLYERQGRRHEAEEMYHKTVEASKRALGGEHPRTEARVRDLWGFEHARRSSETMVSEEAKVDRSSPKLMRAISVGVERLGMVDEARD